MNIKRKFHYKRLGTLVTARRADVASPPVSVPPSAAHRPCLRKTINPDTLSYKAILFIYLEYVYIYTSFTSVYFSYHSTNILVLSWVNPPRCGLFLWVFSLHLALMYVFGLLFDSMCVATPLFTNTSTLAHAHHRLHFFLYSATIK